MVFGGLTKTSLIDYPGHIAATVFFIGCNFACPFCYSSELVIPEKIKKQPKISEKEFFIFLKQRQGLLEGIVLCGGEPTISEGLAGICEKIKNLGYLVKLDTNGSNPKIIQGLISNGLIDYAAMDIKSSREKYEFYSGRKIDIKNIEQSIDILNQGRIDYEFRTTVAPGLEEQDFIKISDWISNNSAKYFLQEFSFQKPILDPGIFDLAILDKEQIKKIVDQIKSKFKICAIR